VMTMPDGNYAVDERDNVAIHRFRASEGDAPGSVLCFRTAIGSIGLNERCHS